MQINKALTAVFLLGWLTISLAARADDTPPSLLDESALGGKWVGMVSFTSEYFSRGVSNTRPGVGAVQSSLEYQHDSGAFVQVWGSNVDFPPPDSSVNIELDYIAGYRGHLSEEASYETFVTYFTYPGADRADGRSFNYWEGALKGTYD